MKKIILILLTLTIMGFGNEINSNIKKDKLENERLCNIYKIKVSSYIDKIKNEGGTNTYTRTTFETYKRKVYSYCNIE